jgi:hypothetical protein
VRVLTFIWRWPWTPLLPGPPAANGVGKAGEAALHVAYYLGFKDGFLLAVAIFGSSSSVPARRVSHDRRT